MTPGDAHTPSGSGALIRSLTLIAAASVVISNIIGTGVFIKARVMTCNVGSPGVVLAVWVIAGFLSIAGALSYAELAAMMPRAGGEYNFLGAAYGRLWAFLFGWTRIIAVAASAAAIAIAFAKFFAGLLGRALSPAEMTLIPLSAIGVATALNLLTARSSGWVNTALTAVKVALVAGLGLAAFMLADGSWDHFAQRASDGPRAGVPDAARLGVGGFGAAMLGALWAYNGWNVVSHIGGEVKDPARNLPRALIGGTGLVMALYLLVNTAYFYVLTPEEVASVPEGSTVAREVLARFAGRGAAGLLAAGMMISAYGTLHTGLLTSPRVVYALARDGLLPASLARVSARGVPWRSVLLIGALSIVFTLSGTFDTLTDMYVFILWIFYALTCASVIVLRVRRPDAPRPFRAWGYPVVPALFILVAGFLLINTLLTNPGPALWGLGLVALGLPVYAWYSRTAPPPREHDWIERGNS